ncbi:MAG: S8 family serine peptidase [Promethearchaeota archaeon]
MKRWKKLTKFLMIFFMVLTFTQSLYSPTNESKRLTSEKTSIHVFEDINNENFKETLFDLDDIYWNEGISGKNITIAILDTGLFSSHEVFQNKTLYWKDVTRENNLTFTDLSDHGTMCASIAAGNSTTFNGIAPSAGIAAIKIFYKEKGSNEVNADNEDALAAVNYILENKDAFKIKVASCSWGDDNQSADGTDELSQIVNKLVEANITTIVAAGNKATNVTRVASPAVSSKVITVGSLDTNYFHVAEHSLPGPTADGRIKPDIIAPGVRILGATDSSTNNSYRQGTGTSFATPIVSGVAALMLQEHPELSPRQVKFYLDITALETYYTGGKQDNKEGWGVINPAGLKLIFNNYWNLSLSDNISFSFSMNKPSTRSFFTKVHLPSGITNEFQISIKSSTGSKDDEEKTMGVTQAYLYSSMVKGDGSPTLLTASKEGKLLYKTSTEGDFFLALKPLPGAWKESLANCTFRISYVKSNLIENSIIAGFIMAISSLAIATIMVTFTLMENKGKLNRL